MFIFNKLNRYIVRKKDYELSINFQFDLELWNPNSINRVSVGFIGYHLVDKRYTIHRVVLFLNGIIYRFRFNTGWYELRASYEIYKKAVCIFRHNDDWDPEDGIDKVYPLHALSKYLPYYLSYICP